VKAPIYVYYEDGENEPVPLYCDKETGNNAEGLHSFEEYDVCFVLPSKIFGFKKD